MYTNGVKIEKKLYNKIYWKDIRKKKIFSFLKKETKIKALI